MASTTDLSVADARDAAGSPPLVLHVVYRFDTGGLENGVVNLINHMPAQAYRHAVLALTEVEPRFAERVRRSDVSFHALHKPPGNGAKIYRPFVDMLRQLRPAVVHTRNLAALEMQPAAAWARVQARVHGEHGRDSEDPDGLSRKHQWIRRVYSPFVHRYIALSRDLSGYLEQRVGIAPARVRQIYNGVDSTRFSPSAAGRTALAGSPFDDPGLFVVGTVGRMLTVKAQPLLAQAFVLALQRCPEAKASLRLVMVGEGPLRAEVQAVLDQAGVSALAWLPGERSDVPEVMRHLSLFALPSLAEGVSNTILEAMATGLPVLATDVGGNAELVTAGDTGWIVPPGDVPALAEAMLAAWRNPGQASRLGCAGREGVQARFSLQAMVGAYQRVYDELLGRATPTSQGRPRNADNAASTPVDAPVSARPQEPSR